MRGTGTTSTSSPSLRQVNVSAIAAARRDEQASIRGQARTTGPRLHVDEAEVVPGVETRGPEHCDDVIGALRSAGYTLTFG
jgi:hypothetical protein